MNIFGKESDLPFSRKSDHKKDERVILFCIEQNIIFLQQTTLCRQLFAGHVVGFRPMKTKNSLHRMINTIYLVP